MPFNLINKQQTFLAAELVSRTVTVPAKGKVGPFENEEMTELLRLDVSRGLFVVEQIDAPVEEPPEELPSEPSAKSKKKNKGV